MSKTFIQFELNNALKAICQANILLSPKLKFTSYENRANVLINVSLKFSSLNFK